ncbi:hypothetical protein G6F55_014574 [Rhizopus delemar]|nr:hypothetical protein G6F55_014574 [Rhizopus delemar]KAG1487084.1 hypothetical protein G6F53_013818 [Rhizopus delemar]KAG1531302.1 hypothetical protein G6F49_013814 [Rhizopus delemar]KAG1604610.1 hypothetical protein G6F45_014234 [Rhizopus arrhizus]
MPKSLAYETQMDIKSAIEHDVLTDVVAKRFGVHQNTVINHANKWMPNRIRKKGGKQRLDYQGGPPEVRRVVAFYVVPTRC